MSLTYQTYQTYQTYLSSLNNEDINYKNNDWGQYYDMESRKLISSLNNEDINDQNNDWEQNYNMESRKFSSFRHLKNHNFDQIKQNVIDQHDVESGIKIYINHKLNKAKKSKCPFILPLIYLAHVVLFVIIFK